MRNLLKSNENVGASFLPEDYLIRKRERRANMFCLTLFAVVMFGVVAAFFVTNQQGAEVQRQQQAINQRFAQAAKDIEQLKQLEAQKQEMIAKAELTAALLEKAPRSVVLAEVINRLPEQAALLQLELKSDKVKMSIAPTATPTSTRGPQSLAGKGGAAQAQAQQPATPAVVVPRMITSISIVGVAASHQDVAAFVSQLQNSDLLDRVNLRYSESTVINDRDLNKFLVQARLRPDADARKLEKAAELRADAFLDDGEAKNKTGQAQAGAEQEK